MHVGAEARGAGAAGIELKPRESVLEIGTGSGYFAALLGRRAGNVTSVEIDAEPGVARSRGTLARSGAVQRPLRGRRRRARMGHASSSTRSCSPGPRRCCPRNSFAQLKPGGRIFAIVGDAPVMTARLVDWTAPGSRVTTDLFETVVAPLVNAAAPARFRF